MPRRNKQSRDHRIRRQHTTKGALLRIKAGAHCKEIKRLAKELGVPFIWAA